MCSVVKFFLVHGNLYRESGEHCSRRLVKSFRLCAQDFTRRMVGGMHRVCVILNLALRKVMPRGMACIFPRRCQGRKFVLGIDSYPGLPVSKLGMCSQALEIAQAELLLIYKK